MIRLFSIKSNANDGLRHRSVPMPYDDVTPRTRNRADTRKKNLSVEKQVWYNSVAGCYSSIGFLAYKLYK